MIKKIKDKVLLKNNLFRAIGIFTIALFFVLVIPQKVYASDYGTTTDGFYYSLNGSHATITGYQWKGGPTDITIPAIITSGGITYTVTEIGDEAFCSRQYTNGDLSNLTSIVIPNSVTIIGSYAFQNCSGLKKLTIAQSVTSIGRGAFYGCSSLTDLTIPDNLVSIEDSVFENCSGLTKITIPNGINIISDNAFYGCSRLTNVTIPDSVTTLGSGAFSYCETLTSITLPNKLTSISYGAFNGCTSLTKMTIPSSVTSIGNNAFYGCTSLTKITIPSSVTFIDSGAFSECTLLGKVNFLGNAPFTGYNALFSDCSPSLKIYYLYGNTGFTNPWEWYPTQVESEATMNNFTATFNSQGGSTVSNVIPTYNNTIIAPTIPTKTGYTFGGWYKEAGCLNAWNFVTDTVTSDTTLYAKWIINKYTTTFNSQGGSALSNENAEYNNVIMEPVSPTKTDYTFGGWYKEAGSLNVWNFVTDTLTSNTTLYAKWIPNYDVIPGVDYRTHVQTFGWQEYVSDGALSGTVGKSKRLEAINIKGTNLPAGAYIEYEVQVQTYGWNQGWKRDGQEAGTDGQSKRLEAIKIRLVGMPGYSVEYKVQVQTFGWQGWVKDGALSGTVGISKRLEAIQIKVVPTDSIAESSINDITAGDVSYLVKRSPSYSDLVANGDIFYAPEIYDGKWIINIIRPNGLAEGQFVIDKDRTVSFVFPSGEVYEVTPY